MKSNNIVFHYHPKTKEVTQMPVTDDPVLAERQMSALAERIDASGIKFRGPLHDGFLQWDAVETNSGHTFTTNMAVRLAGLEA